METIWEHVVLVVVVGHSGVGASTSACALQVLTYDMHLRVGPIADLTIADQYRIRAADLA